MLSAGESARIISLPAVLNENLRFYYLVGVGRLESYVKEQTVVLFLTYFLPVSVFVLCSLLTLEDTLSHGATRTALFHESYCRYGNVK